MKTFIFVVSLLAITATSSAQDIDEWNTTPDGHMVVTYRMIDKDGVHFATFKYRIAGSPHRVPECNEVHVKGKRMYLITQESNPMEYSLDLESAEQIEKRFEAQTPYMEWVK